MNDQYVSKYVGLGWRTASPEEILIRRIARDLKIPTNEALSKAAPEMAALIDGPCWLVPVPASEGNVLANRALANAIAALVPGARVICALARAQPVMASTERRARGLPGPTIEEHCIVRIAGPIRLLPVYFIDNVVTTGTTLAACRCALGWGSGLTYADASGRGILKAA